MNARSTPWTRRHTVRLGVTLALFALVGAKAADEAGAPPWPKRFQSEPYRVALYEPQIEAYEGEWMRGRAAVSVARGDDEPVFGALWFGMSLRVARDQRLAVVTVFRTDQARFPVEAPADADLLSRILGRGMLGAELEFDPLLRSLERERAAQEAAVADPHAVPDILWVPYPAAVVRIDGEPELRDLQEVDLMRVVNADAFMVVQKGSGRWYLRLAGEWLTAMGHAGPWNDAADVPASVLRAAAGVTDLAPPVQGKPRVIIATGPLELIETDGEPSYGVIPGTTLLYVTNTDEDVFLDIADQRHYVLFAGRWFAAPSLSEGPWQAVAPDQLPATFAAIPPSSAKYGVLVHVPGTQVAADAVQEAQVPQIGSVERSRAPDVQVEYSGPPEFVRVESTPVYYAVNTPYSVLRVDPYYYLCHDGVWYWSAAYHGPWAVSISVPAVIYTIPPYYPVYPVTYVRVYDWTPSMVYVGYTSGYLGWHVGWGHGLVFGIGYYDRGWYRRRVVHHHHYYYTHPACPRPAVYHGYHYGGGWHRPYGGTLSRREMGYGKKVEHTPKPELVSRAPTRYVSHAVARETLDRKGGSSKAAMEPAAARGAPTWPAAAEPPARKGDARSLPGPAVAREAREKPGLRPVDGERRDLPLRPAPDAAKTPVLPTRETGRKVEAPASPAWEAPGQPKAPNQADRGTAGKPGLRTIEPEARGNAEPSVRAAEPKAPAVPAPAPTQRGTSGRKSSRDEATQGGVEWPSAPEPLPSKSTGKPRSAVIDLGPDMPGNPPMAASAPRLEVVPRSVPMATREAVRPAVSVPDTAARSTPKAPTVYRSVPAPSAAQPRGLGASGAPSVQPLAMPSPAPLMGSVPATPRKTSGAGVLGTAGVLPTLPTPSPVSPSGRSAGAGSKGTLSRVLQGIAGESAITAGVPTVPGLYPGSGSESTVPSVSAGSGKTPAARSTRGSSTRKR